MTPPRRKRHFCGEGFEDERAVQEILWNAARSMSGASFDITSSPEPAVGAAGEATEAAHDAAEVEEANPFGFASDLDKA